MIRIVPIALALAALLMPLSAAAGMAPPTPRVEMRLLDGGLDLDVPERRLAGVELRVEPGWKTYWRQPGDSGFPPRPDFSASTNVAEVEVQWPAPQVSHDGLGWVIGYEEHVVFPLLVTPEDPDRPVTLVLDLDYAVCADICVPLQGEDTLRLSESGPDGMVIERFRARVPVEVGFADPRAGVRQVRHADGEDGAVVEMTVEMPGAEEPTLIVEGARDWHVGVAELVQQAADGEATYRIRAASVLDEHDEHERDLTVTAISPGFSFVQRISVP